MPQIYIREDQYDSLVALDFSTRDDLLGFVRVAIATSIEKEERKRKKEGK